MLDGESTKGLFWTAVGAGPPIIAVHGAMGFDHTYFRPWLDRLGEHARVVYLDLSGCGASSRLVHPEEISLERWADDVETVRSAAGFERTAVLGHSLGTWVALEYARRWPERISGLILSNGTPVFDYAQEIFAAAEKSLSAAQLADLETIFSAPTFDDATFRRLFLSVLTLYFYRYKDDYGSLFASAARYDAAVYLHMRDRYLTRHDCTPWLDSVAARTLVVAGRHDIITPPVRGANRLAEGIPQATLHVLEHSGHFPFIEEPEAFVELIGEWLEVL